MIGPGRILSTMFFNKVNYRLFINQPFPSGECLLCGCLLAKGCVICPGCWEDLPWLKHCCAKCAEPLPRQVLSEALCCGRCLKKPPAFATTLAPLSYEFPIEQLINRLKRTANPYLLKLMRQIFVQQFAEHILQEPPQLIIPVPLHYRRQLARGHNPASEWARELSQHLGIPFAQNACQRIRHTPHQQGLTAKQRSKNLQGAFSIQTTSLPQHIALVDDVMTTGSTVNELAKCCSKAGATKIDIWCMARTPVRPA